MQIKQFVAENANRSIYPKSISQSPHTSVQTGRQMMWQQRRQPSENNSQSFASPSSSFKTICSTQNLDKSVTASISQDSGSVSHIISMRWFSSSPTQQPWCCKNDRFSWNPNFRHLCSGRAGQLRGSFLKQGKGWQVLRSGSQETLHASWAEIKN